MVENITLDALWNQAAPARTSFDPAMVAHLPPQVQRFLSAAIMPGVPLARAVRLKMSGEIKLKDWHPFEAEQVISWDRGFIWRATAHLSKWVSMTCSDRFINGEGDRKWSLFGVIPMIEEAGQHFSLSSCARMELEASWLPTVLVSPDVDWRVSGRSIFAHLQIFGHESEIEFLMNPDGDLTFMAVERWGDVAGDGYFDSTDFGSLVVHRQMFNGITVPSTICAGWNPKVAGFDGEFIRCTVESAEFK